MPVKRPVPPPEKPVSSFDIIEYVVQCAVTWRRLELQKSELAEGELESLREGIDLLNARLVRPPTSPPPPRKR